MNSIDSLPSQGVPRDEDLAEQARPGHGVPSQDPDPAAQLPLTAEEAEREAKSALAGGGMVGGAALGATIGVAVGGPLGVVVGAALGAVAGAAAGSAMRPLTSTSADPVLANPVAGSVDDPAPASRVDR